MALRLFPITPLETIIDEYDAYKAAESLLVLKSSFCSENRTDMELAADGLLLMNSCKGSQVSIKTEAQSELPLSENGGHSSGLVTSTTDPLDTVKDEHQRDALEGLLLLCSPTSVNMEYTKTRQREDVVNAVAGLLMLNGANNNSSEYVEFKDYSSSHSGVVGLSGISEATGRKLRSLEDLSVAALKAIDGVRFVVIRKRPATVPLQIQHVISCDATSIGSEVEKQQRLNQWLALQNSQLLKAHLRIPIFL